MFLITKDYWEIKDSPQKGRGVYARKEITAGTVIGDYIGRVLKTAQDDTVEKDEGLYLMYYHDFASLYPVDTKAPGVHLINHSCTPNAALYIYKGHTLFFALRRIFVGEEITISYQMCPIEFCPQCTHLCKCGSKRCSGSMHLSKERFEKWRNFIGSQSQQTKRMRICYGKELKKLSQYHKNIPDYEGYDIYGSSDFEPYTMKYKRKLDIQKIRMIIRETGRIITTTSDHRKILGVESGTIITDPPLHQQAPQFF